MKKEKKSPAEEKVEEKRVAPTVIRRRPARVPPKVVESAKGEVGEGLQKASPLPAREEKARGVKVSKKAREEVKVEEVLTSSREAPEVEVERAPEKVVPLPVKKEKKEVKVFIGERPSGKALKKQVLRKGGYFEERDRIAKLAVVKRVLKKPEVTVPKAIKRVIKVAEVISVGELSQRLGVKAGEIIKRLMDLGIMATINQFIDVDAAQLVAHEFGYEVENVSLQEADLLVEESVEGELKPRAPVVTVMGHVDHGKTTLLDAIRKTNVVATEAGGITQHIGAYHVHLDRGDITFLDTPGHEAFTAMRARGAKVTDIVVLVVAADDGVMPQTVEAINHARAANVPIVVAINKIDLPGVDPRRVKQALMEYGLVPEEWGGDTIFAEVSAKKGIGVKELLEFILLQAEVLELKATPVGPARGTIVEARLDKGRGPVATVLIQGGTLRPGDAIVAGVHMGRVRAMVSDLGKKMESAGPSIPVEVLGLSGVPEAGDPLLVVKDEVTAKQIASIRLRRQRETTIRRTSKVSLTDLYERMKEGGVKELRVVVKGDAQGSIEAVEEALQRLSTEAIKVHIIHSAVGGITEGDVMLASASNGIIIGFNMRPEPKARELAEKEGVDIRLYNIIYDVVDDVRKAMEGMLEPTLKETVLGRAEVRQTFRVSKVGTVAGCYITDGRMTRGANIRLIRDNVVICEGRVSSLKRFKEDVREVLSGYECGMGIEGYNDIKVGDIIEAYEVEKVAARL